MVQDNYLNIYLLLSFQVLYLKNDIKEKIKDKKLEEDKTLTVTALDEIRKNYKLKIKDSKLKKLYKEYIKEQIENSKEKTNE